jgi:hypothetical protein
MTTDTDAVVVRVRDVASGHELQAWVRRVGGDVVIAVSGGEGPHVGCVVLATPSPKGPDSSPSVSVLTIPPHKEEPIARAVAVETCRRHRGVAVVTAGVHEDGLDRAGIEVFLRLGGELAAAVAEHLCGQPADGPGVE